MLTTARISVLAITLSLFMLVAPALGAEAGAGNGTGTGGDGPSSEFVSLGNEVLNRLQEIPMEGVDTVAYSTALKGTKVVSYETLELDGRPVDAINYPKANPPLIELSKKGWEAFGNDLFAKKKLVLHEYLGIMGLNDANYQISQTLDIALVCLRTPWVRHQIERFYHMTCERILPRDLKRMRVLSSTPPSQDDHPTGEPFPHGFQLKRGDLLFLDGLERLEISQELYGQETPISTFDPKILEEASIQEIRFYNQGFTSLEAKGFSAHGKAKALVFYENPVTSIGPRAFAGNSELESLQIASLWDLQIGKPTLPYIEEIDRTAFEGLPKLKSLLLKLDLNKVSQAFFDGLNPEILVFDLKNTKKLDVDRILKFKKLKSLTFFPMSEQERMEAEQLGERFKAAGFDCNLGYAGMTQYYCTREVGPQ